MLSFNRLIAYHIYPDIIAQALVARQQVIEDDGTAFRPLAGLHHHARVDLQRREVVLAVDQRDRVHLQLAQLVVIVLPQLQLVHGHEHAALVLAAEQLLALVGALREALAAALLLEVEQSQNWALMAKLDMFTHKYVCSEGGLKWPKYIGNVQYEEKKFEEGLGTPLKKKKKLKWEHYGVTFSIYVYIF